MLKLADNTVTGVMVGIVGTAAAQSLVAMLGCLFALLDERSGSTWMLAVGLLVIAGSMIASNFSSQQEEQYRGFTSEAAIVITYGLGAAVWLGYATLAVMLAIATTVLLYFKMQPN